MIFRSETRKRERRRMHDDQGDSDGEIVSASHPSPRVGGSSLSSSFFHAWVATAIARRKNPAVSRASSSGASSMLGGRTMASRSAIKGDDALVLPTSRVREWRIAQVDYCKENRSAATQVKAPLDEHQVRLTEHGAVVAMDEPTGLVPENGVVEGSSVAASVKMHKGQEPGSLACAASSALDVRIGGD
jgi:hypothetical protein